MYKYVFSAVALVTLALAARAQPEFYADPFLGYPEFRILPLRLPTENPDSSTLEVHVRILYDDLQFIKSEDDFRAGYGLDVIVEDEKGRVAGNNHFERELTASTYSQTNSRQMGDQTVARFTLKPARYHLRVNLVDRESRKDRLLDKELVYAEKDWRGPLQLGDLALLDSAGTVQMNTGLVQGQNLRAPIRIWHQGSSPISVDYQLQNDEKQVFSSGQIPGDAEDPFLVDTLSLPTDKLPNGSYYLVVLAKSGETQRTRAYPFKIIWQDLPDFVQDVDTAIRQLRYIATDEEMGRFQSASSNSRAELFREFWKKRDPTPATSVNEKMDEYYRRIGYANQQFGGLRDGWETDMGRVYIIFGSPTDIERHPFDIDKKPYEVWYYYDLNRQYLFVDEDGFGDYRLKTPIWHDEY